MRRALISLALLHSASLFSLAWHYAGDDPTLTADQRSFGAVMLGLAGALMFIGATVAPRTPGLAVVPFGLAGLLTMLARSTGHLYLFAFGGWALLLAVLAIATSRHLRASHERIVAAPSATPLAADPVPPSPNRTLAAELRSRIPTWRHRRASRAPWRIPGGHRPRSRRPVATPATRPNPLVTRR